MYKKHTENLVGIFPLDETRFIGKLWSWSEKSGIHGEGDGQVERRNFSYCSPAQPTWITSTSSSDTTNSYELKGAY